MSHDVGAMLLLCYTEYTYMTEREREARRYIASVINFLSIAIVDPRHYNSTRMVANNHSETRLDKRPHLNRSCNRPLHTIYTTKQAFLAHRGLLTSRYTNPESFAEHQVNCYANKCK